MRYFGAKVLVPLDAQASMVGQWEEYLLGIYGGFHKGASVEGHTLRWGKEYMVPYHVGFDTVDTADATSVIGFLERTVKDLFAQEAVYIAVTELAAPYVH